MSKDVGALFTLDQAIASNWVPGTFYSWNESDYQALTTGGSIRPLSGYWVRAKTAGVRLILPKPFPKW